MSEQEKEAMTGITLPDYGAEVVEVVGTKGPGHPLFWGESKGVEFYIALFQDFNVTSCWDLTPGSGSAACAAAMLGITYEGVTMNEKHANWLNNIMDKAIFAILSDKTDDKADAKAKETRAEIQCHFATLVEEGRQYLQLGGDGDTEDDASDDADDDDNGNQAETS